MDIVHSTTIGIELEQLFKSIFINNENIRFEDPFEAGPDRQFEYLKSILYLLSALNNNFDSQKYLAGLKYKTFLNTRYWLIISNYMKWKSNYKCSLCDSENQLNTHHKKYTHLGMEWYYIDDLIVLCNKCHSKHHGVK